MKNVLIAFMAIVFVFGAMYITAAYGSGAVYDSDGSGPITSGPPASLGTCSSVESWTDANDLLVCGDLEVIGNLSVDSILYADNLWLNDAQRAYWGTSADAVLEWEVNQTNHHFALGVGATSKILHVALKTSIATDHSFANRATPTVIISSDDKTTPAERLELTHDGTDGVITTASGDLLAVPASLSFVVEGTKGSTTMIKSKTESVTFAADPGDASKATTGTAIPDGALLMGVSTRVTTAGTNCTSIDVGVAGVDDNQFADNAAITANSTTDNSDATAVFALYHPTLSDTEITVTGVGGNCFDLVVAITTHYLDVSAATSN